MNTFNFHVADTPRVDTTLASVKITFFTYDGGNDKDKDSKLKLTVFADYGGGFIQSVASKGWEAYGPFNDKEGTYKTIDIPVNGTFPLGAVSSLRLKIEFEPNGDDTWKFHYDLDLTFSNGVLINKAGKFKELSDNKREMTE